MKARGPVERIAAIIMTGIYLIAFFWFVLYQFYPGSALADLG